MSKYILQTTVFLTFVFSCLSIHAAEFKEMVSPFTKEKYKVSVLSEDKASEHFKYLASKSLIPFNIKWDGCYGRAYLMNVSSSSRNIEMAKIIVEVKDRTKDNMEILSDDGQWLLRWYYHVAPMVFVKSSSGELIETIMDPSLFDKPVTKTEFLYKLTKRTPEIAIDTFYLPKYIFDKDQKISEINMRKVDSGMMANLAEVQGLTIDVGEYHEKMPVYDPLREQWFKGGWPVKGPKVDKEANQKFVEKSNAS